MRSSVACGLAAGPAAGWRPRFVAALALLAALLLAGARLTAAQPVYIEDPGSRISPNFFELARVWGPSNCPPGANPPCRGMTQNNANAPPNIWTIHGLWPAMSNTLTDVPVVPTFCFPGGNIDVNQQPPIPPAKLMPFWVREGHLVGVPKGVQAPPVLTDPELKLVKQLKCMWPTTGTRAQGGMDLNIWFWQHEWLKHGTCSTLHLPGGTKAKFDADIRNNPADQIAYFTRTLTLHNKHPLDVFTRDKADKSRIRPGDPYTLTQLEAVFRDRFEKKNVKFTCGAAYVKNTSPPFLKRPKDMPANTKMRLVLEVSLCFKKEGRELLLADCPLVSANGDPRLATTHAGCGGGDMYDGTKNVYVFVNGGADWASHPDHKSNKKYQDCLKLLAAEPTMEGNIGKIPFTAGSPRMPVALSRAMAAGGAAATAAQANFVSPVPLRKTATPTETRAAGITGASSCLASAATAAVTAAKGGLVEALKLTGTLASNDGKSWALILSASLRTSKLGKDLVASLTTCLRRVLPGQALQTPVAEPRNWLFTVSFGVDTANKVVILKANTGNYLYMLDVVASSFKAGLGLTPKPPTSAGPGPKASMRIVADAKGMRSVGVKIEAAVTPVSLASRLGFAWPLDSDMLTIANPNIIYTSSRGVTYWDGSSVSGGIVIEADIRVPPIGLKSRMLLDIRSGSSVTLEMLDEWRLPSPASFITLNPESMDARAQLLLTKTLGLQGTIPANIGGLDMDLLFTVANKAARAQGTPRYFAVGTAYDVPVAPMVKKLWPSCPNFLLDFMSTVTFSKVQAGYSGISYFIKANPAIEAGSLLDSLLQLTKFKAEDIVLSVGTVPKLPTTRMRRSLASAASAQEVASAARAYYSSPASVVAAFPTLSLTKTFLLRLGDPFTTDPSLSFTLDAVPTGFEFTATFATGLRIPGVLNPAQFSVSAGVSVGAKSSLKLEGESLAPIAFKDFPFLTIQYMALGGAVNALTGVPTALRMAAQATLLGAQATVAIEMDIEEQELGFLASMDKLDLARMLGEVGVKTDLGGLNLQIDDSKISFADVPIQIGPIEIPQGLFVRGTLNLFNLIQVQGALAVDTSGAEFDLVVDATKLNAMRNRLAADISETLASARATLRATLEAANRDAQAAFENARADVVTAKAKFDAAMDTYSKKVAQVNAALDKARVDKNSAKLAFDKAVNDANAAFSTAQTNVNNAQNAFNAAKADAERRLNEAAATLASAQASYNSAIGSANTDLNNAQNAVNSLQGSYNYWNNICCCGNIWDRPGACIQAGGLWVALGTANAALNVARDFLNSIVNGAVGIAFRAAQGAVATAQASYQSVLTGAQWVALGTATAILDAARTAAQGVLRGTQFVALEAAEAALNIAQAAFNALADTVEAVAKGAAQVGLNLADLALQAAQVAVEKGLGFLNDMLAAATKLIDQIASNVLTAIQLNRLEAGFTLRTDMFRLAFGIDISLLGQSFQFSVNLQTGNLLEFLKELVGKAVRALIKQATSALPGFGPEIASRLCAALDPTCIASASMPAGASTAAVSAAVIAGVAQCGC